MDVIDEGGASIFAPEHPSRIRAESIVEYFESIGLLVTVEKLSDPVQTCWPLASVLAACTVTGYDENGTWIGAYVEVPTTPEPAHQTSSGLGGSAGNAGEGGEVPQPPECTWAPALPQPTGSLAARWLLADPPPALPVDPAEYILLKETCISGLVAYAVQLRTDPIPDPAPPPALPPPDPQVLAHEAVARLPIPLPGIGIGPTPNQVAVKIPGYLWITNAAPQTATATDRGLSITATASINSVTWSMGEPDLVPGAQPSQHPDTRVPAACSPIPAPAISFTCPGPGAAHPQGIPKAIGYGHTYRWKSLPERTNGTGHWPITASASATWIITWTASTGETGTDTITRQTTLPVSVGEWTTVLVAGG